MSVGERIKQLRSEHSWSQADLASTVKADARQISRYENDKITPSAETLIHLAQAFDVSVDYLLFDDAPRKPLQLSDPQLQQRLKDMDTLTVEDRASLIHIIDALLAKHKVKSLLQGLE